MVICHTAKQRIGFGQLTWDKEINNHDLLLGLPSVTNITMTTLPQQKRYNWIRVSLQDEITLTEKHKVLLGARLDYNTIMGLSLLQD
jgi:outer membrane receptor for ferrienterochelin and colicins